MSVELFHRSVTCDDEVSVTMRAVTIEVRIVWPDGCSVASDVTPAASTPALVVADELIAATSLLTGVESVGEAVPDGSGAAGSAALSFAS